MMATSKRRLPMRRVLSILTVLLVSTLMVLPAVLADTGGGGPALTEQAISPVDLSTRAQIDQYLTSVGMDPADLVVQRGEMNYAGPDCPGAEWTCTQDTDAVLQISSSDDDDDDGDNGDDGDDGDNVFVCSPPAAGTNAATNTCVIVQTNTTGTNRAVCREHNEQEEGMVQQSCTITQTNVSGQNIAVVDQSVLMDHEDTTQRSEQRSDISQTNGTGSNYAGVSQRSTLSTEAEEEEDEDVFQEQDVIQNSVVDQDSSSGAIRADVFQSHRLEAEAEEADNVDQLQNATPPGGTTNCFFLFDPNICAFFDQDSATGSLLINSRQTLLHDAEAEEVEGDVFQQQGSSPSTGGMAGVFHQDSGGVARRFPVQIERQNAEAEDTTQEQYTGQGPRINTDQVFNTNNVIVGNQLVIQTASDPTIQQLQIGAEAVPITGEATFNQRGCQNDECKQQTISGGPPGVVAELGCDTGEPPGDGEITVQQETECFAFGGAAEEPSPTAN
jgi:hypothetical protein